MYKRHGHQVVEMNHGVFQNFGPHFIEKLHGTYGIWIYFDFGHLSDTPTSRNTFCEEWTKAKISIFLNKNSKFDWAGWGAIFSPNWPNYFCKLASYMPNHNNLLYNWNFLHILKCIQPPNIVLRASMIQWGLFAFSLKLDQETWLYAGSIGITL